MCFVFESIRCRNSSIHNGRNRSFRVYCNPDPPSPNPSPSPSPNSSTNLSASSETTAVQVYRDFERSAFSFFASIHNSASICILLFV